jgi:phage tail-like protein
MPINGAAPTYHQSFRFFVEIEGVTRLRFKNCSELASEFETIEHYEGGVAIPNKTAGRMTFDDITLERGVVTGDFDLYEWHLQAGNPSISAPQGPGIGTGVGAGNGGYKRNLSIVQLDIDGSELRRWRVYGAWAKRFVVGAWDNDADEVTIESVTLTYDFFEREL